MDMFEYADSIDWKADYLDMNTFKTYHISTALNHDMIPVSYDGQLIEVLTRKKGEE